MKYFYEKPDKWTRDGWKIVQSEHPLFNRATLLYSEDRGFLVVQQHFDPVGKSVWWGSIDPWLACDIRRADRFQDFFEDHADEKYSFVISVRKLMWEMRMKPLPKEFWESQEIQLL